MIIPKNEARSFRPNKKLGQHFLRDSHYINKIISELKIEKDDVVIEIGPGTGALTFKLTPLCKKLYAIEIDSNLALELSERLSDTKHVVIIHNDILKIRFNEIAKSSKLRIVGNLPYNISSQIVFKLIEECEVIQDAVLMFQKELAEKLIGKPRTKKYGPITIFTKQFFDVIHLFDVPASAFYPLPKVTSTVLLFTKRAAPLVTPKDQNSFERFVKSAFTHRRKKLIHNFKTFGNERVSESFEKLGISLNARAEELSICDFYKLYETLN